MGIPASAETPTIGASTRARKDRAPLFGVTLDPVATKKTIRYTIDTREPTSVNALTVFASGVLPQATGVFTMDAGAIGVLDLEPGVYTGWHGAGMVVSDTQLLLDRLAEVEARVKQLESQSLDVKTVILRDLTLEEARGEVLQLLRAGRPMFYSDLAEAVGLSLESTVQICADLAREGLIVPAEVESDDGE